MSTYHQILNRIQDCKCKECNGLGICNDSEPGDMFYNQWVCATCKGTGLNAEISLDIVKIPVLLWYVCHECGDYDQFPEEQPIKVCRHCGSDHLSKTPVDIISKS